jgi:hypothetical protein
VPEKAAASLEPVVPYDLLTGAEEAVDHPTRAEFTTPGEAADERTRWAQLPAATVVLIAVLGVLGYIGAYTQFLNAKIYPVVRSDGAGYYSYLPAYLLQHDPTFHTFVAHDLNGNNLYDIGFVKNASTGNYLMRYPVGEAVMLAPFFVVGHFAAELAGSNANGYSGIEQGFVGLAALVYLLLGLLILSRALRRFFGPVVLAATLFTIVFGTDLYHYATFDSMFSHAFSFVLVAALIELSLRWYDQPGSLRVVIALAVVVGLLALVRPTNIVFVAFLPLLGVSSLAGLRDRLHFLWQQRISMLTMALASAGVFAPQLLIWREATGHLLVNSYAGSGYTLDFLQPHLFQTLFSFNPHGLFPWSPLYLLAWVGLVPLWRHIRHLFVAVLLVALLNTYLIASWANWWYGGGYGQRAFIDLLPLMAFPLAALYSSARSVVPRLGVGIPAAACCLLVTIQMIHYWQFNIGFNGADWSDYVRLLRTSL